MELKARLLCPSKHAMQAGLKKTKHWIVEFPRAQGYVEPLMGWVGTRDTHYQQKLSFASQDEAVAYLEKHGIAYEVIQPAIAQIKPKRYGEHFSATRVLK